MMPRILSGLVLLAALLSACGAPAAPTSVPPTTAPAAATATTIPPTAVPPTATNVPPTATALPPTPTAVPPTATPLPSTPTLLPSPIPTLAKKEFTVSVKNFEFTPRDIKINAGTTVTWVVEQGEHTTTSDDFRTKGPNAWHSGNLTAGQKFSFTFQNAGEFRFFCGFHSEPGAPLTVGNMNGLVTVSAQ
jgi:plastocyanin